MTNAGALRLESDASTGDNQHRRDHELWLAMRAAHHQWMEAAEALEHLAAMASSDAASPDVSLRVAQAAEEERGSFEAYIEARLAFSEFLLTRDSKPGNPEPKTISKRTLLAAALVFPAIFGLPYAMHERKQVRDLDAARAAISALANQPRAQTAEVRVEAPPPVQVTPAVATTVQTPAATGHWRRVGTPPPQQQKRAVRQATPRKNIEFRLTRSTRYAQLGPIRVSLQNVDQKHDWFDLSVLLGDFKLERKHVRRYEAIWINLSNSAPIRLIADRIGRNEVHGYLGTPAPKPPPSTSQRIKNAGTSARGKSVAQSRGSRPQNGG